MRGNGALKYFTVMIDYIYFMDLLNFTLEGKQCMESQVSQLSDIITNLASSSNALESGLLPQLLNKFKKLRKIGCGGYGVVYQVQGADHRIYAMKKYYYNMFLSNHNEIQAVANILKELEFHSSIPKMHNLFFEKFNFYMILDYYPLNLLDVTKRMPYDKDKTDVVMQYKSIMYLILDAVSFLHSQFVIHRDLKPENIMISIEGELKLVDFDLATKITNEKQRLSRQVGTLYYKPAELLLGEHSYGYGLDLWALGCIFAELYLGYPIFKSDNEIGTLVRITEVIGAPNKQRCPRFSDLESYIEFSDPERTIYDDLFKDCPNELREVIKSLLCINPLQRPKADQLFSFEYFTGMTKKGCLSTLKNLIN